jgi:hypothetical protein
MANQKLSRLILVLSIIFASLVSLCILFLLIIGVLSDKPDNTGEWIGYIIMFLAFLLYLPVYGFILKRTGKPVEKAAPYIKGGLFIVRLFILAILTFSVISMFGQIKSNVVSALNISASKSQVAELLDYIEDDNYYDLMMLIQELESDEREIDYIPLVAKNFEMAVDQALRLAAESDAESAAYGLNERLSYFNTLEEIKASIDDYAGSPYAALIPQEEMIDLLIRYGELCAGIDMADESGVFFDLASRLDPDNMELVLDQANALYSQHYLQESVDLYNRYMSLMRNEGKDRQIPSRVREFVRSERYGRKLQTDLYECWIKQYPADNADELDWYIEHDYPYVLIDDKVYGAIGTDPHTLLYGYEFWDESGEQPEYFGLSGCFARLMGREPVRDDHSALERLTGLGLFSTGDEEFMHVNPEIIEWVQRNLVPDPGLQILGVSCQSLYDALLREEFRNKALGYSFLTTLYSLDELSWEYENRMYDEDFYGFDFLYGNFNDNAYYNTDDYAESWILVVEAGFWLRRMIDGSYEECWNALSEVLQEYDADFYEYSMWREWEYAQGEDYWEEEEYD